MNGFTSRRWIQVDGDFSCDMLGNFLLEFQGLWIRTMQKKNIDSLRKKFTMKILLFYLVFSLGGGAFMDYLLL